MQPRVEVPEPCHLKRPIRLSPRNCLKNLGQRSPHAPSSSEEDISRLKPRDDKEERSGSVRPRDPLKEQVSFDGVVEG